MDTLIKNVPSFKVDMIVTSTVLTGSQNFHLEVKTKLKARKPDGKCFIVTCKT